MPRKIFIFAVIIQALMGFGTAFSQTPPQSETSRPDVAQNLAADLFEAGKAAHDGNGVPQDFETARTLYLEAADLGSTQALINLGYLYFTGQGVAPDFVKSREFYDIAAKLGSVDAKENLKMMDAQGLGISPVGKPVAQPKASPPIEAPTPAEPAASVVEAVIATQAGKPIILEADKIVTQAEKTLPEVVETAPIEVSLSSPVTSSLDLTTPVFETNAPTQLPQTVMSPAVPRNFSISHKPVSQSPSSIFDGANVMAAMLMGLSVFVLLAQLINTIRQTRERKIRKRFADYFYEAKRNDLRLTYLRRREVGFAQANFYREWQATLTALMARYALNFNEPDEALLAFCKQLNDGLKMDLRPTKFLASEFSDEMLKAAVTDIRAVDAFQMASIIEDADTSPSNRQQSDVIPNFQDNVVKLFQIRSRKAT